VHQARAVVADVSAITQALIVLDKRYANVPHWEHLRRAGQLGWAALACAIDAASPTADYSVDHHGWRPPVKAIRGPAKPGLLGVLQAEHNLQVGLRRTVPTSIALRLVADSQRTLSDRLSRLAAPVDPEVAAKWRGREQEYRHLLRQLRNVGGPLGKGSAAAAEGANVVSRLAALPRSTEIEPRILAGFNTLFYAVDNRIADIIRAGIEDGRLFERIRLPRLASDSGTMVRPVQVEFVPLTLDTRDGLLETSRGLAREAPAPAQASSISERSRAQLLAALVHRPPARQESANPPRL
jgi:hypothetical protein